jgi:plastocyanin
VRHTRPAAILRGGALIGAAAAMLGWGAGASAATYVVTMTAMSYGKIPASVAVGDTINWVNHDTVPHTVTARDKSFDLRVNPNQTVSQSVQKAGTFPFYCIYHATMRGTLKVTAK